MVTRFVHRLVLGLPAKRANQVVGTLLLLTLFLKVAELASGQLDLLAPAWIIFFLFAAIRTFQREGEWHKYSRAIFSLSAGLGLIGIIVMAGTAPLNDPIKYENVSWSGPWWMWVLVLVVIAISLWGRFTMARPDVIALYSGAGREDTPNGHPMDSAPAPAGRYFKIMGTRYGGVGLLICAIAYANTTPAHWNWLEDSEIALLEKDQVEWIQRAHNEAITFGPDKYGMLSSSLPKDADPRWLQIGSGDQALTYFRSRYELLEGVPPVTRKGREIDAARVFSQRGDTLYVALFGTVHTENGEVPIQLVYDEGFLAALKAPTDANSQ